MATFSPQAKSWREALRQHNSGFISVVTRRLSLFDWIYWAFNVDPPDFDRCGLRISIAEMHRMYMRALQIELVDIGVALQFADKAGASGETVKIAQMNLEPAMAKYTQAIRDYEFMTTKAKDYDYFVVSSERHHEHMIMHTATRNYYAQRQALYKNGKNSALSTGPWEKVDSNGRANPIGETRNVNLKRLVRHALWYKLAAAIVGTGFLVGPMWLLALKQQLYFQLEVTTGFVFVFGFVLVYFVDGIDQVFAGTLAYAAVLMVFVGLSIQGTGGSQAESS